MYVKIPFFFKEFKRETNLTHVVSQIANVFEISNKWADCHIKFSQLEQITFFSFPFMGIIIHEFDIFIDLKSKLKMRFSDSNPE